MAIKICLDAGHYGKYNRSPVNSDYYESDMTWKLHLLLKKELESYGFVVTQTRSNQAIDKGLSARGQASKGCNLFLSIHSNAWSDASYDYPLVIVMQDGKGDALGNKLAECIEATIGTKQDGRITKKRGTYGGEWYSVLAGAASVGTMGMIVEHSFHTNAAATEWLLDDANLAKLAKAEAKVIAEHYGVAGKAEAPAQKPATTTKEVKTVNIKMNVLEMGAKGEQVKTLQMLLMAKGYDLPKYGADGDFGTETKVAVIAYQEKVFPGKPNEWDGIVGAKTWNKILGVK